MRVDLAGPARRSIAFMVDTLVVSLLLLAVAAALTMAFGPAIRFTASPGQPLSASFHDRLVLVGVVSSIILSATYFAVSWSRFRATPGQYMLGLRVSNRSSGGQLSVARADSLGGAWRPTLDLILANRRSRWLRCDARIGRLDDGLARGHDPRRVRAGAA